MKKVQHRKRGCLKADPSLPTILGALAKQEMLRSNFQSGRAFISFHSDKTGVPENRKVIQGTMTFLLHCNMAKAYVNCGSGSQKK